MKRLMSLFFLVLISYTGISAQGLYVGVEGKRMYENELANSFWEFGAYASYSRHLALRLGFDIEAGLNTKYYPDGTVLWLASPPDPNGHYEKADQHAVTFGGKLATDLTLKVAGPISLFGGLVGNCNFFQKDYVNGRAVNFSLPRAGLQWRVGLTGDIMRFRIRAAFIRDITTQDGSRQNGFSVSLTYRL